MMKYARVIGPHSYNVVTKNYGVINCNDGVFKVIQHGPQVSLLRVLSGFLAIETKHIEEATEEDLRADWLANKIEGKNDYEEF